MKYLLYCIFKKPQEGQILPPTVPNETRVQVSENEGLCAAFSEVSDEDRAADVNRLMQYHHVIESFFEKVDVIPFRFGTRLDSRSDIDRLRDARAEQYREVLRRIHGCVEMGIKAISPTHPPSAGQARPWLPVAPSGACRTGKHYLAARKTRYDQRALENQERDEVMQRLRSAFSGQFRDFRSEVSLSPSQCRQSGKQLLSLYFLVPKECLSRFNQRFSYLQSAESGKLLLSGPWPPYNFVLPPHPSSVKNGSQHSD